MDSLPHSTNQDSDGNRRSKEMDSSVLGDKSALLQQLVGEAVQKIISENPILAGVDHATLMKSIDTKALLASTSKSLEDETKDIHSNDSNHDQDQSSSAKTVKKHRLYLPPPGTPSYNPTPISELNKRKQNVAASIDTLDIEKLENDSDITDFSSDDEEASKRKSEFDLLEEVLVEDSLNRKTSKRTRKKTIGKIMSKVRNDHSTSVGENIHTGATNMVDHSHAKTAETSTDGGDKEQEKSVQGSDLNENSSLSSFLPPSPVFTSSSDGFNEFSSINCISSATGKKDEVHADTSQREDKQTHWSVKTDETKESSTSKVATNKDYNQSVLSVASKTVPRDTTKERKGLSGHNFLPQVVSSISIPKLKRPVKSWNAQAHSHSSVKSGEDNVDLLLQRFDGDSNSSSRDDTLPSGKATSREGKLAGYKVDLDKEIQSLMLPLKSREAETTKQVSDEQKPQEKSNKDDEKQEQDVCEPAGKEVSSDDECKKSLTGKESDSEHSHTSLSSEERSKRKRSRSVDSQDSDDYYSKKRRRSLKRRRRRSSKSKKHKHHKDKKSASEGSSSDKSDDENYDSDKSSGEEKTRKHKKKSKHKRSGRKSKKSKSKHKKRSKHKKSRKRRDSHRSKSGSHSDSYSSDDDEKDDVESPKKSSNIENTKNKEVITALSQDRSEERRISYSKKSDGKDKPGEVVRMPSRNERSSSDEDKPKPVANDKKTDPEYERKSYRSSERKSSTEDRKSKSKDPERPASIKDRHRHSTSRRHGSVEDDDMMQDTGGKIKERRGRPSIEKERRESERRSEKEEYRSHSNKISGAKEETSTLGSAKQVDQSLRADRERQRRPSFEKERRESERKSEKEEYRRNSSKDSSAKEETSTLGLAKQVDQSSRADRERQGRSSFEKERREKERKSEKEEYRRHSNKDSSAKEEASVSTLESSKQADQSLKDGRERKKNTEAESTRGKAQNGDIYSLPRTPAREVTDTSSDFLATPSTLDRSAEPDLSSPPDSSDSIFSSAPKQMSMFDIVVSNIKKLAPKKKVLTEISIFNDVDEKTSESGTDASKTSSSRKGSSGRESSHTNKEHSTSYHSHSSKKDGKSHKQSSESSIHKSSTKDKSSDKHSSSSNSSKSKSTHDHSSSSSSKGKSSGHHSKSHHKGESSSRRESSGSGNKKSSSTSGSKKLSSSSISDSVSSRHESTRKRKDSKDVGEASPDTSTLEQILEEDWSDLMNDVSDNAHKKYLSSESDPYDLAKIDDDQGSDDDDDKHDGFDPSDPDVLEECRQMFDEYSPEECEEDEALIASLRKMKKRPSEEEESLNYSKKQRIAKEGAFGNMIAKPVIKKKKTPAQIMMERYQKLKEEHAILQRKLKEQATDQSVIPVTSSPQSSSSSSGFRSPPNPMVRKRMAPVSNVSSLVSARNKIKAHSAGFQHSQPSSSSAQASGSQAQYTSSQTSKGSKRVAHQPKTETLARPTLPAEPGSKVPQNVRQRYLNSFVDECLKFCDSKADAYNKAVAEEKACYKRASSRMVYLNLAVNTLKRLRAKEISEAAQEILAEEPEIAACISAPDIAEASTSSGSSSSNISSHPVNQNHRSESHFNIILGGGQKGSWSIEKPKKASDVDINKELKGELFYKHLKKYILTDEQLGENGFPRADPENKGKAAMVKVDPRKKISPSNSERYCARCSKLFMVDKWGFPTTTLPCVYHWGRPYKKRGYGGLETRYSCCQGDNESEGCCQGTTHVSDNFNPKELTGYVHTIAKDKHSPANHGIYALDCEMCYTTAGNELTRITVIGEDGNTVYETLVRPDNPILDYNTRFSGITEEDLDGVKTTIRDVQAVLLTQFSKKTILMGHSLESDFCALKLIHGTVVDTSVVFPHKMGPPFKRALKNLASEYLKKIIQNDVGGHDSAEDAITCMELMRWRVKEDLKITK